MYPNDLSLRRCINFTGGQESSEGRWKCPAALSLSVKPAESNKKKSASQHQAAGSAVCAVCVGAGE